MKPPVPYYGGKQRIADQIVALLPAHEHYVEPYAGSLSVLLAKPMSRQETANDADQELMTFWRVLRDRHADLERVCGLTPHSRAEYEAAWEPATDDLEVARRVFVRLTQGRTGRLTPTGWRFTPSYGGQSAMPTVLQTMSSRIGPVADRLARVTLECLPALDLIARYGQARDVLLYVDPPYVANTRNGTAYRHEMASPEKHRELAVELRSCAAAVVLSGYPSELYDAELYPDWHRTELSASTAQGGQGSPRTEVLWSNRPLDGPATLFDADDYAPDYDLALCQPGDVGGRSA